LPTSWLAPPRPRLSIQSEDCFPRWPPLQPLHPGGNHKAGAKERAIRFSPRGPCGLLEPRAHPPHIRAMPYAPFVPLRVLSSYSMLEGAIDPKAVAKLARERGFPAIAICDRNGLYGTPAFAAACKAEGVQPIVGALLGVARGAEGPIDYLPLYVQDQAGWENLCHLVSRAHLDRPLELEPHVRLEDLAGRTEGLIALTGAGEGAATRLLADG